MQAIKPHCLAVVCLASSMVVVMPPTGVERYAFLRVAAPCMLGASL